MQGTFIDGNTNRVVERELTDEERLTMFLPQVALTAGKTTVNAESADFVTIEAQLHSVPLSDGSPRNLEIVHTVILLIGDTEIRLETEGKGRVSCELEFSDVGTYTVRVVNLHSNVLEIKAV